MVAEDRDFRDWLKNNAITAYKIVKRRLFRRRLTRSDRIDQQRELIRLLEDSGFVNRFTSLFSYLKFLMSVAVRSVEAQERGAVFSNFHFEEGILYLPQSYDKKTPTEWPAPLHFGFEIGRSGGVADFYTFYVIPNAHKGLFPRVRTILDGVVRKPRTVSEEDAFREELRTIGLNLSSLRLLQHFQDTGTFALSRQVRFSPGKAKVILTFVSSDEARRSMKQDLEYLLDFEL